jgi:hypothetical protein
MGKRTIFLSSTAPWGNENDLAEEYLAKTKITQGLFLVLVGRTQAPVWEVTRAHHLERKQPMPYVNHYSFHILDPDWAISPSRSADILHSPSK